MMTRSGRRAAPARASQARTPSTTNVRVASRWTARCRSRTEVRSLWDSGGYGIDTSQRYHDQAGTTMRTTKELLKAKRDGQTLSNDEITAFINGVVNGDVTSAQAAAFCMAACTRGLDAAETAALTMSMTHSGDRIERGTTSRPAVDKHSTGGVGDKTSLLLVPLAVACGITVPMISGRGLGHTGGTVDKLESIVGYRTAFDLDALRAMLHQHGFFMVGQSSDIAPADKVIYALRDATGTVENIGLITASILSKKFAEGLDGLVMDMKVGRGAFMRTLDDAHALAASLRDVCAEVGIAARFLFTRMDQPIGRAVGNLCEVIESEAALRQPDAAAPDLVELTEALAAAMVQTAFPERDATAALEGVRHAWRSGAALDVFYRMVEIHGGDWHATLRRWNETPAKVIIAETDGVLGDIDAMAVANAGMTAGVGRMRETDDVDPCAGIVFEARTGQTVHAGDVLARVYASDSGRREAAAEQLRPLLKTTTAPMESEPSMIIEVW
ncbi:MAG: thymidine phosphorylase [Candidatus Kapabacteria bacterium]|nr:thymidine phosphorylase [Candidatus Kapabacteria bacterium]